MKHFLFIRHGKTRSNIERRYIGNPEEPLSEIGRKAVEAAAKRSILSSVARVFHGPALRCRQTAEILFPNTPRTVCPMNEIDFGVFKNKNADELKNDAVYKQWLATDCMGDIPGGDSVTAFKDRCCENFLRIAENCGDGVTALVIHGGNIMSVMERFAMPKRDFYDYHIANCEQILCRWENGALFPEDAAQ